MGLHSPVLLLKLTNIKSALSLFLRIPLKMAETAVENQLDILIKRLNEAERRAKLLKFEVKSIRGEIGTLQQSLNTARNGNISNISRLLPTRSLTDRGTILLNDLPETSVIDAPYKRPPDDSGASTSKKSKFDFNKEDNYVVVYVDGACENNGKSNAKAGIGVWFGECHPLNISKPVNGRPTNNTAEIQACVEALKVIKDNGENNVKIFTDSEFTINCMTKWIKNWKKNNWKTASKGDVKNKEDLQVLDRIINTFSDVKWIHVRGHRGIRGNEEADKLAREGALHYKNT